MSFHMNPVQHKQFTSVCDMLLQQRLIMMFTPSKILNLKTSFLTRFPKILPSMFGIFGNFGMSTKS